MSSSDVKKINPQSNEIKLSKKDIQEKTPSIEIEATPPPVMKASEFENIIPHDPDIEDSSSNESTTSSEGRKLYICDNCGKHLKSEMFLERHKKSCLNKALVTKDKSILSQTERDKSMQYFIDHQREILNSYFDVLVGKGKVHEAYEEFKIMRSNPNAHRFIVNNKFYDILLR